jgi:hypothetical protein
MSRKSSVARLLLVHAHLGVACASEPAASAPPADPWKECPTAEAYAEQPAWPHPLAVTEDAVYCVTFSEAWTLKEALAAKGLLRVAPGTFRLPGAAQPALGLPLCLRASEDATPVGVTSGTATYETDTRDGKTFASYQFEQPVEGWPGGRLSTTLDSWAPEGQVPAFRLDGGENDATVATWHNFFWCPEGADCAPRHFDSCTYERTAAHQQAVTLGGGAGAVTFELRLGSSPAGTEPGAFVRAHGTFRGRSFDQRSYWRLVYSPGHHHFVRNFAVLFDEPIDGACGLQAEGLRAGGVRPVQAHTVTCSLDLIDVLPDATQTDGSPP